MTNDAPSRAKAAALGAVAFFCALIPLCLALSACPARPQGRAESADAKAPVFPHGGALREASAGAPVLFAIGDSTRQRAVSRTRDGFVAWDSRSKEVRWLDSKGAVRARAKLDAAFAWVTPEAILARGEVFVEDKGFAFTLYQVRGTRLVRRWTRELDCFPSDVLVSGPGIAVIAGGDRANERNSVWRVDGERETVRVLSIPKNDDFLRLVDCGTSAVAFASGREKRKTETVMYEVPDTPGDDAAGAIPVIGLPETALCPFGYGFAFAGEPVVPVAEADGSVSLARLRREGTSFRVVSLAKNSGGCLVPLGEWPRGTYGYLAHDALADAEGYWLGAYDGECATLEKLE